MVLVSAFLQHCKRTPDQNRYSADAFSLTCVSIDTFHSCNINLGIGMLHNHSNHVESARLQRLTLMFIGLDVYRSQQPVYTAFDVVFIEIGQCRNTSVIPFNRQRTLCLIDHFEERNLGHR